MAAADYGSLMLFRCMSAHWIGAKDYTNYYMYMYSDKAQQWENMCAAQRITSLANELSNVTINVFY